MMETRKQAGREADNQWVSAQEIVNIKEADKQEEAWKKTKGDYDWMMLMKHLIAKKKKNYKNTHDSSSFRTEYSRMWSSENRGALTNDWLDAEKGELTPVYLMKQADETIRT